jgi:hypothetical protein
MILLEPWPSFQCFTLLNLGESSITCTTATPTSNTAVNISNLPLIRLYVDNAWQPFQQDYYNGAPYWERTIMNLIKGPLWYFASIGHW